MIDGIKLNNNSLSTVVSSLSSSSAEAFASAETEFKASSLYAVITVSYIKSTVVQ